ncbi:MAG: hypothetical protein FGM37_05430 [Phycisphaerales bacterium]|nr:hypothetical protein [Phycisphaerales bacterium]
MPTAVAPPILTAPVLQRSGASTAVRVRPSLARPRPAGQEAAGWWRGGNDGSVTIDDDRTVSSMSQRIRLRGS